MPGTDGTVRADDGCLLWHAQAGQGEPLIVCHGGPGLWDMFGSLAAMLAREVRVVRWDQRGCGRSERCGPYSVARSVADLDAVRTGCGLERIAVLGHSWGATLALRYTLDHPERVSALIYVSGTGLGWDWHEPFQRAAAARLAVCEPRLSELSAADEDRELAILQWSAEFTGAAAMGGRLAGARAAARHAGHPARRGARAVAGSARFGRFAGPGLRPGRRLAA